jgi:hypothetical protein
MKILRGGQLRIVKFLFLSFTCQIYGQDAVEPFKDTIGLPNFSIVSAGYEILANVFKPSGDSVPTYTPDHLDFLVSLGEDTSGLSSKKIDEWVFQDSLVERVDYFQNIFFDFKSGTVTYVADDKYNVDTIAQVYADPINTEECAYVVWIYTNGGYNTCTVNLDKKELTYDWYFEDKDYSGTFKFVNSQFIEY